ncbi:hypothetical protein [uncultured Campylobacter sp.]|uniref:hypothetical protein n=1 Tax=uncultured Campylobacter sp. TaxID=218934 RepID=UPI0028ED8A57|nr:hypothetical protein [uncultured Campylobacter sp.]
MEGHLRRADEARGVNLSSFTFETHSNLARKLGLNLGLIAVLLPCARTRLVRGAALSFYPQIFYGKRVKFKAV